jgi:hypothetical protein
MTHQSYTRQLKIKAAARERDGYRCTTCGMTNQQHRDRYGRQLHVHRKEPGSLYSLRGCVTVCEDCHKPLPKREPGQPDLTGRGTRFDLAVSPDWLDLLDRARGARGLSRASYVRQAVQLAVRRDLKGEGEER